MSELKDRIKNLFIRNTEEELFGDSVKLAKTISQFAHLGQQRLNGENYYHHPYRMVKKYYILITHMGGVPFSNRTIKGLHIPTHGVTEVAFLHDVVEDTDITHEDIRDLYYECGFQNDFDLFIDQPLRLITHDKSEPYESYIEKVKTNQIASLVKMLDLSDNLDLFGLQGMREKELTRAINYVKYFKSINDKHKFLTRFAFARYIDKPDKLSTTPKA